MAQVYRRISTPYMPNATPDKTNAPSPPYAPGEIGCAFTDPNGISYLRVYLDSGATATPAVGVVAAGQLAFWKDKSANLVTNDPYYNDTGTAANCINRIAGIFTTAVSTAPGTKDAQGNAVQYYCDVVINGKNVTVKSAQAANTVPGFQVIADGVTGGVKCLATASTAPTSQVVGVCRSSAVTAAGTIKVDVNLGFVD